ncbi:MAG: DNA helicase IV [Candidatus Erwinia impunctatus]|nr:DNA helicase IV [Culicoides impunctatus]
MELKATRLGKHLAQHPYDRVKLLHAGVEVSGEQHHYLIPFNQLLDIVCRRGLVWGELEFTLPDNQVVRLHGTDWSETQHFYQILRQSWQSWSQSMSQVAEQVLCDTADRIEAILQQNRWLAFEDINLFRDWVHETFSALPLPEARLREFAGCERYYSLCIRWLEQSETERSRYNQQWAARQKQHHSAFFSAVEQQPLNDAQIDAVINGERNTLLLAEAGSGKTAVLIARTGWLMLSRQASAAQVLLLTYGRQAAEEINERLRLRLPEHTVTASTFHSLALSIIEQATGKKPRITMLGNDTSARHQLLITVWREQCASKKSYANGWRQWLNEIFSDQLEPLEFWGDEQITQRWVVRADRWLALVLQQELTQAQLIASASESSRELFSRRIKLLAPLIKAWKKALKEEGAIDFFGLIRQAVALVEKKRFISPWKHILVDEFQDLSPQRAALLAALQQQNDKISLFAVGDDWQSIYRFSGADMQLTTAFSHYFGGQQPPLILDITYRFNNRIGAVANAFIQQNPAQSRKALTSLEQGNKKSIVMLPESQTEALLDKMSGFVKPHEKILLLARYHYLKPSWMDKAKTRWPNLAIEFMTIHASKGQEADFVLLTGLQSGREGFPAQDEDSVIESVLLPATEHFPYAEERRLAYVAITRARQQVWLLYDAQHPSCFVDDFAQLGVSALRKP